MEMSSSRDANSCAGSQELPSRVRPEGLGKLLKIIQLIGSREVAVEIR
jgi:hypothetical protein